MNAVSPASKTGLPVKLALTADDTRIDTDQIASVEIWWEANRVPRARIVIYDGQPDSETFPFSDAETFVPGAKIVLSAGYDSDLAVIHRGVVVRHGLRIVPGASAQLVVDTSDPLLKMTLARHSAITEKATDAALISALVSANGGSVRGNAAATTPVEAMVQAHASDWDLMLLRAEANGCVVVIDDSEVAVIAPTASTSPVLTLEYGESILSFDAQIDAVSQLGDSVVNSRAWSYSDQAVTEATPAGSTDVTVPGNLKTAALAEVLGVSAFVQQTAAARGEDELGKWSAAALMRAKLSQFTGTVKFQGSALAKPGTLVTLAGLGERFNGDAFVSGVRHLIRGGDWHTTADLGMPAERFASRDAKIVDPPAAGLAPPLRGLHVGQVKAVAEDPNGDFRVQVTLPLTDPDNAIWARLAQPYASEGFGWSFFPEVGDEVVLGFMNEDPASAVILASVYSSQRAPTHTPEKTNDIKALVTRSKMEVNFNDKDVILKISTPGGRYVELDDKAGTVTVTDPNANKLVMKSDTVELISAANMTIKSATNMTIDCGANLTIKAAANCDMSAVQINATASGQLALASNGMGSLKAAAILEVNGALVKIN
jgi:Rhs element Vgr protein